MRQKYIPIPPYEPSPETRIEIQRNDAELKRVEAATVELLKKKGRGVLVPGGYILTVAHCINWSENFSSILETSTHYEEIRTGQGTKFFMRLVALDPVIDIAILEPPDYEQSCFEKCLALYDEFCEQTRPVAIFQREWRPQIDVLELLIYNLDREWIKSDAKLWKKDDYSICFRTSVEIQSGTSGGPVVTPDGQLVGLVSHSRAPDKTVGKNDLLEGHCIRPIQSVPSRFASRFLESGPVV